VTRDSRISGYLPIADLWAKKQRWSRENLKNSYFPETATPFTKPLVVDCRADLNESG
jgi:hypothetical protein